jgi:hypothetical protein
VQVNVFSIIPLPASAFADEFWEMVFPQELSNAMALSTDGTFSIFCPKLMRVVNIKKLLLSQQVQDIKQQVIQL